MSWLGRVVRLIPVVILFVLVTSCNGFFLSNNAIQSVAVAPTAVLLEEAPAAGTPGGTYQLSSSSTTVGGTPADDTATATWTSSSANVTASAGLVTAVGTAATNPANPITVTATDGGTASNAVDVLLYAPPTPTSLFLNGIAADAVLAPNTYQLQAYFGTSTAYPLITDNVIWTSSDTTSATVSSTGLVTVLSIVTPAPVTITATADIAAVGDAPTANDTVSGTVQFTAD